MRRLVLTAALLAAPQALAAKGAGAALPEVPSAYNVGDHGSVSPDRWWRTFGERTIDELIDEALEGNLDLQGAQDRIRQAQALELTATSAVLPTITFDSGINGTPAALRFASFAGGAAEGVDGFFYQANAGFNAGMELDITGRNVLGIQAAKQDRLATLDDRDDIAVVLTTRIVGAWFDVALQGAAIAVTENQIKTNRDLLEIVELRFERGEATAVDVLQQRQQVASSEAQLAPLRAARAVSIQQLAILLGRPPQVPPADLPEDMPELPPAPSVGSPQALLDARPDLRAAERRLTSAWQRRMASERQFLPTLRISANAGWNFTNNAGSEGLAGGNDFSTQAFEQLYTEVNTHRAVINQFAAGVGQPQLPFPITPPVPDDGASAAGFQQWFTWGIGATLSIPIFNAGRNIATLKQNRAAERAAAHALGSAQLQAWAEVEGAWGNDDEQQRRLEAVRVQLDAAESAFEAAVNRYVDGVGDYLSVLTTLVAMQAADFGELQAHRDALNARIQLHDAIGGAWTSNLQGGSQ